HLLGRFPRVIHFQVEISERGIRHQEYPQRREDDSFLEVEVGHVQIDEYNAENSTVSGSPPGCPGVPVCSFASFSPEKLLESSNALSNFCLASSFDAPIA